MQYWLNEVNDVVTHSLVVAVVGSKFDLKGKQPIETAPAEAYVWFPWHFFNLFVRLGKFTIRCLGWVWFFPLQGLPRKSTPNTTQCRHVLVAACKNCLPMLLKVSFCFPACVSFLSDGFFLFRWCVYSFVQNLAKGAFQHGREYFVVFAAKENGLRRLCVLVADLKRTGIFMFSKVVVCFFYFN